MLSMRFILALIVCSAVVLSGCGRVQGPDDVEEEFTFTAEDVVRFRELAQQARSRESETGTLGIPYLEPLDAVSDDDDTVYFSLNEAHEDMRADTVTDAEVYRVTNEFLNVRTESRVTASIVKRLVHGDAVTVLDFTDAAWARVKLSDGKEGFVAQRYIARLTTDARLPEEKKEFDGMYFVDFGFVNVRRSPDQQSEKFGELAGQAIVRPISMDSVWARIPFQGKEGYVARQYLSPFFPNFLVRQDVYTLPILQYSLTESHGIDALGKEGYVARQYLSPFFPNFLVRQDVYTLPILQYSLTESHGIDALLSHTEK